MTSDSDFLDKSNDYSETERIDCHVKWAVELSVSLRRWWFSKFSFNEILLNKAVKYLIPSK